VLKNDKLVKHEHHPNSSEEGDTANIKQEQTLVRGAARHNLKS
jgi:hypothetical protein